jgi:hypothetical protein
LSRALSGRGRVVRAARRASSPEASYLAGGRPRRVRDPGGSVQREPRDVVIVVLVVIIISIV